ncbi:MAG: Ig-like domain repeat protein [Thermoleophilia bacterium]
MRKRGLNYSGTRKCVVMVVSSSLMLVSLLGFTPTVEAAAPGLYVDAVLADHPAAYYRLADAPGPTAIDTSGNGNAATYAPGVGVLNAGATADGDAAATTGQGGELLSAPPSPTLPAPGGSFTVEAWIKRPPADLFSRGDSGIVSLNGISLRLQYPDGYYYPGSVAVLRAMDANGTELVTSGDLMRMRPDDGDWHLVDFTWDARTSMARIFIDGAEETSALAPTPKTASVGLQAQLWYGALDDVAAYDTALGPAQISGHWSVAHGVGCSAAPADEYGQRVASDGASRFYRLSDPGSRVAVDASGNCLNARRASAAVDTDGPILPSALRFQEPFVSPDTPSPSLLAPSPEVATGTSRTYEVWFRRSRGGGPHDDSILISDAGLALRLEFPSGYYPNGDVAVLKLRGPDGAELASTVDLGPARPDDGRWHQAAFSWAAEEGALSLYLDGAERARATASSIPQARVGILRGLTAGAPQMDIAEAAAYPSVLRPAQLASHWLASGLGGTGPGLLVGRVLFGGEGVEGAVVEACNVAGACADTMTDITGSYRLTGALGTYVLTAFPPAGGPASVGVRATGAATTTSALPAAATTLTLGRAALPAGTTMDGTVSGSVATGNPVLSWYAPSTVHQRGCINGTGVLTVRALNPAGLPETRAVPLVESPVGSGDYVAHIPPLSPLHGRAEFTPFFRCEAPVSLLPAGGPEDGGIGVVVHVPGGGPVTRITFGAVDGTNLTALGNDSYVVTAPPGRGSVVVRAHTADSAAHDLGAFQYAPDLTVSPPATGPAGQVPTITITGPGIGIGGIPSVIVGSFASPAVRVVSPNTIVATLPQGTGRGQVLVVASNGVVQKAGSVSYPEPVSREEIEKLVLEGWQVGADYGSLVSATTLNFGTPAFREDFIWGAGGYAVREIFGLDELPPSYQAIWLATTLVTTVAPESAVVLWPAIWSAGIVLRGEQWLGLIDPSGTVVDLNGNPVPGATVSLARRQGDGSFAPVPEGSPTISPTLNPETTGSDGVFHWDAVAGIYTVSALSSSCVGVGGGPAAAATEPFAIPPPKIGIILELPCTSGPPPPPVVRAVSPAYVASEGGVSVTVVGSGFARATEVLVRGTSVPFTINTPGNITFTAPAGTGAREVQVVTPAGTSLAVAEGTLTYRAPVGGQVPTDTTLTGTPNPAPLGADIVLSATVVSGSDVPTGIVSFREGTTLLATAAVGDQGHASAVVTGLGVGRHQITATYAGDGAHSSSVGTATEEVADVTSRTTATVAPNPSTFGASVSIGVTVSASVGAPSGSVTLTEMGNSIGSGALDHLGQVVIPVNGLSVGSHTITVTYLGTSTIGASSDVVIAEVGKAPTITTLSVTPNPVPSGAPVALQATVSSVPGVSGSVTFTDGSATLGTAPIVGGAATLNGLTFSQGAHALAASYSGNGNFSASQASTTLAVTSPSSPTLGLVATATSARAGQAVTLTAKPTGIAVGAARLRLVEVGRELRVLKTGSPSGSLAVTVRNGSGVHRYQAQWVNRTGRVLLSSSLVTVTWTPLPHRHVEISRTPPAKRRR